MKIFTVRLAFGAGGHPIHYPDPDRPIFRTKYGDEPVGFDDREGWFPFGEKRIKIYRSQIDYTLWLDRKEYSLEKLDLPRQAGFRLCQSYWPSLELIRSLRLQQYTPPREVVVKFAPETKWTTTFRSGRKV